MRYWCRPRGFRGRLGSSTDDADLRAAIDHHDAEPALVQIGMTAPTQQAQIVQIGAATMTPMHHMVGLGEAHLPPATHTPLSRNRTPEPGNTAGARARADE